MSDGLYGKLLALTAFWAVFLLTGTASAKCVNLASCLCLPGDAVYRVEVDAEQATTAEILEVIQQNPECPKEVGDDVTFGQGVEVDPSLTGEELFVGSDCDSVTEFLVIESDERWECRQYPDTHLRGTDARRINTSDDCLTQAGELRPNPPCNDTRSDVTCTHAPPGDDGGSMTFAALLGLALWVRRRISKY